MQPIKISTNVVVVEGGWLKKPWVLDVKIEDGRNFFEISHMDRNLARCVGLDVNERAPFAETTVVSFLAKMRNKKVDELIIEDRQEADPNGRQRCNKASGLHIHQTS